MRLIRCTLAPLALGFGVAQAQLENDMLTWAKKVDGPSRAGGHAVVVDGEGYSYAAGYLVNDMIPRTDAVLTKFMPNGDLAWSTTVSNGYFEQMSLDSDDNPIVAGEFSSDRKYIYVNKYNPSGTLLWERRFGATEYASTTGVSADPNGNIYLVGRYGGIMDIDPGTAVRNFSTDGRAGFICKLSPNGNFEWAHNMGRLSFSPAVFDSEGNMYLSGSHAGTVDFDLTADTLLITPTSTDGFAWKVSPTGENIWLRFLRGASFQSVAFHAVDSEQQMILGADFEDRLEFGGATLNGDGSRDIALMKLDESGDLLWMWKIGGPNFELSRSLQVDSLGYLYMSGFMAGSLDLYSGRFPEISAPGAKYFLAKFDPEGLALRGWAMHSGDTAQMVAVGPGNEFFACGTFSPAADFEPGPSESVLVSSGDESEPTSMYVAKYEPMESAGPVESFAVAQNPGITNADQLTFEVTFDKPVIGFNDAADLNINHTGTTHTDVSITGGPERYTVVLFGVSGDGSVSLEASTESDIQTIWGVGVGSSSGARVDVDNTAPGFGLRFLVGPDILDTLAVHPGSSVTMQISYTEALQGESTVTLNGVAVTEVSGNIATYQFPENAPFGAVTIVVSGTDIAGNSSVATFVNQLTITEIVIPPTLEEIASEALLQLRASDVNQDGAYSFSEFQQVFTEDTDRFAELDYNGDERLSPPELQRVVSTNKPFHTADTNLSAALELDELIRIVQIYNAGAYGCATALDFTEDGYALTDNFDWLEGCIPHSSDFQPEVGTVSLNEVLRAVQLYNFSAIRPCDLEDGFCAVSD